MNVKERAMAAILGEEPDKIPWLIYPVTFARPFPADLDSIRNLPLWRELRSKGLGLSKSMPVYRIIRPHVKVKKIRKGNIVITMFQTPVGNLTMRDKEIQNFPEGSITWRMEYPIKSLQDYEVFKFIVEDTEYQPDYKLFIAEEQKMDGDGIVKAGCPKSPLQEAIYRLMGYKRFALDLYTHPKEFQELMESMRKKYMEAFSIIAESPADIVHCDDNVNAAVTSPQLFERFLSPYYNDATKILHKAGKLFEVHMDGKLRALKDLIAKTDIDIIEAFTPPPMGDLHVREARESWRKKAILVNFPGSVWHLGEETIRKVTIDILREAAPRDRFLMGVTEWIPDSFKAAGLRTITDVLWKYGKYPIAIP